MTPMTCPETDSPSFAAAEAVSLLAELVDAGRLRAARARTARLLAEVDPAQRTLLGECVAALERHPRVAAARLAHLWRIHPDEADRALIEQCVPRSDRRAPRPLPADDPADGHRAPAWSAATTYRAPSTVRVRQARVRPGRRRSADEGDAEYRSYAATRAGVDDTPEPVRAGPGYQLDYDLAAVAPVVGIPCLLCWTERSRVDRRHGRDDLLCRDCRGDGHSGAPIPPTGSARAAGLAARCAFIAAVAGGRAREVLIAEWRRAGAGDAELIVAWVKAHPLPS